jgi:aminoglycoside phosphotransferase (APT) family kinase protein
MVHEPLDLGSVARALAEAFPDAGPVEPLRVLGEGFRSTVVMTTAGIAFKIGRSSDAPLDYAREWRVLPLVRRYLRVPVPDARWYVEAARGLPFGALGYPALPGRTPPWGGDHEALARDLGALLAELHAVPVEEAQAAGVPAVNALARLLDARPVIAAVLRRNLQNRQFDRIEAWWDALVEDPRMRNVRTPGPELPADVVSAMTQRYTDAYELLTGNALP